MTKKESACRHTAQVLREVAIERAAQDSRFGEQNHADWRGSQKERARGLKSVRKTLAAYRASNDSGRPLSFYGIQAEEFLEAVEQALLADAPKLREELKQVAAVAVLWIEAIDRRGGEE